ncbi:MAG: TonB-dependent receptor, partial [Janthinobacterium lividum]
MVLPDFFSRPWRDLAWLLILLVLLLVRNVQAQPGAANQAYTGRVSGCLLAAPSGQPVPFADVLLLRVTDSTLVSSTQTGLDGTFQVTGLAWGQYLLRTQALNFQSLHQRLTLTAAAPALALGLLRLLASTTQLAEVQVRAEKAIVEQQLGKTVINVEKDLSSVGGTAVNVLENVPSVAVDASGTVSLRGSANLTILLDGKPTSLSNGGAGPRLDQLPASRIAQIEVITNPSAKYDASGAGVINIITKKSNQDGWDGQVALVAGTGSKYAPSLHVSRHHGKATFTLDYDGLDQVYQTHATSAQAARLPDGSQLLTTQAGTGSDHNRTPTLGLGLGYALSAEQGFSVKVSPEWDSYLRTLSQELTQQTVGSPVIVQQQGHQRYNVSIRSFAVTGDYHRTWATHQGRALTASFSTSPNWVTSPLSQTLDGGGPPGGFQQDQRARVFFNSAQADYVHPSPDGKGRFETGVKLDASFIKGRSATLVRGLATGGDLVPEPG